MTNKGSAAFPVVLFFSPDTYFHPICRSWVTTYGAPVCSSGFAAGFRSERYEPHYPREPAAEDETAQ